MDSSLPKTACTVSILGGGGRTAKELMKEFLVEKAKNLTCNEKREII